jgi:hypothetical protein
MTSPLRRKHRITARNTRETSSRAAVCGGAAFLTAIALLAGQITPAIAEDGLVQPGSRLVWHPVRPERSDDAAQSAPSKAPEPSNASVATKSAEQQVVDTAVQKCSGECDAEQSNKAPRKLHSVVTAQFNTNTADAQTGSKGSVRVAAGQNTPAAGKSSNVALTDPFGDTMPSVRSRRLAMTPPDDINTLPAPNQNTASPMRIQESQQDPVELTPPEPLRSGLPRRTVKTYQPAEPAVPAPDLLPYASPDKLPLRNPEEACKDEYDHIKAVTLNKLSIDIIPPGAQAKGDQVPYECGLSTDEFTPRCWPHLTYTWKASALCHKPLYFEEVAFERYGHSWGPYGLEDCQSFIHFFGELVLLPYNVGVQTPCECDYALGYYRPGDCAPWICDPFPLSCRGVMTGAVGYCAFAALFP